MMMRSEQIGRSPLFKNVVLSVGLTALLLLVLAGLSLVFSGSRWDGHFPPREYQIVFRDASGHPLQGVRLQVEDEQGNQCLGYPVTDFVAGNAPTSDADGVITFHHVWLGLEFGGRDAYLFWLFPVGDHKPPSFVCRFFWGDQEVWRVPFRDLRPPDGSRRVAVRREWDWATCRVADHDALRPQRDVLPWPGEFARQPRGDVPIPIENRAVRNVSHGHGGKT